MLSLLISPIFFFSVHCLHRFGFYFKKYELLQHTNWSINDRRMISFAPVPVWILVPFLAYYNSATDVNSRHSSPETSGAQSWKSTTFACHYLLWLALVFCRSHTRSGSCESWLDLRCTKLSVPLSLSACIYWKGWLYTAFRRPVSNNPGVTSWGITRMRSGIIRETTRCMSEHPLSKKNVLIITTFEKQIF